MNGSWRWPGRRFGEAGGGPAEDHAGDGRARELYDPEKLPAFHDPFAGGGSLPLEAQRLGLEAHASDLNPVAVLINKAMIVIPPRFAGRTPGEPGSTVEARARCQGVEGCARAGGRCPVLRPVDARRG